MGTMPWSLVLSCRPAVLTAGLLSKPPGELITADAGPTPRVSHSPGPRWGPKYISKMFPGDTRVWA